MEITSEKTLTELQQSLHKLVGLHRQLLEIVRAEHDALVNANLKGIQEATFKKEALLNEVSQVESVRKGLTGQLALMTRIPVADLKLSRIILLSQERFPKISQQLQSSLNALDFLIRRISEQNKANSGLLEHSLRHIRQMKKNVLGESHPFAETYTKRGERHNTTEGARILSKEA